YAVAGHPPPLLIGADGTARYLNGGRSPMLGADPDPRPGSAVEPLPPGATLLLYTDGLVERRTEDLGTGLERLRRQASELGGAAREVCCDTPQDRRPDADGVDDVAMVGVRLPTAG